MRVEQDHHVALVLHQALGLFQHHLRHLHVPRRRLVEGGGHHLAAHGARHVRHLLRPLVDEQHHQEDLGVVGGDRLGDVLEHHRLAGARRRDDQRALAHADRRDQVDDAVGVVLRRRFAAGRRLAVRILHREPAVRVERRQIVEVDALAQRLGRLEVDGVDLEQREVALAVLGRADLALDGVAGAQAEAAHLGGRDVDVVRPGQEIRLGRTEETEAVGQDLERAFPVDRLLVLGELLEDGEHDVLLAQGGGVLDLQLLGEGEQVRGAFCLEF